VTARRFDVRSGAAALACERWGAGPRTAVLLHAGVADRRSWAPVAERLAGRDLTAVAYDRRGFGETVAPPEDFTHAHDLLRVLDDCGASRAWLVGSSQGGRVAIDLALERPDRVAGLVLVAPAVSGAPHDTPSSEAEARLAGLIEAAEERDDIDELNRREVHLWLDGPEQPEGRVGGWARELVLEMNGLALAADDPGDAREPPDAWARLGAIDAPTLVLWGDLDLRSTRERSAAVARLIPGARARIVPGTAHLPHLERPDEVAREIASLAPGAPAG
jgi:pimeloyl-ACP methyl ester carboxylesterase